MAFSSVPFYAPFVRPGPGEVWLPPQTSLHSCWSRPKAPPGTCCRPHGCRVSSLSGAMAAPLEASLCRHQEKLYQ